MILPILMAGWITQLDLFLFVFRPFVSYFFFGFWSSSFLSACLSFYSFVFLSLEMILPILGGGWIMRLLNLIFTKLPPEILAAGV